MRIFYFIQFFSGPRSPGTLNPRKLVRRLAGLGHEVHVLCTDYNIITGADEAPEEPEEVGGGRVLVHRLPSARGLRKNLRARLRTYLGYSFRAFSHARKLPPPDLVLGSIQPLFAGLAALGVARMADAPFVLEIRDLWPDALVVKKAITPWQAAPLEALARLLYRSGERIASLTPGIKAELVRKGIPGDRIDVFPNGYDPPAPGSDGGLRERVRSEMGWGGQFVALYAGTHVEVTAVDTIVRAASRLRDRPDIRFDLFGSGQRKPAAVALAAELGLTNIHFHDPVPKWRVAELLAAADAGLMTLFKSPIIDIYFENKLMDYMGAGLPILAAMDGMQGEVILRAGAGRVVPSLDDEGLARLVLEASQGRDALGALGASGRDFVRSHLLLPRIHGAYASMLEEAGAGCARDLPPWEPF